MKPEQETLLKDLLYTLKDSNYSSPTYARGIWFGTLTTIMALKNCSAKKAIKFLIPYLPNNLTIIPQEHLNIIQQLKTK